MSTKFYIKNDNGNILSMDGKTRYTLLEGKAAYDFLKTEDGKRRCFHIETDENGEFFIDSAEYLDDAPDDNWYGDFTYAGDGKYQGCIYERNVTVVAK